VRTRLTFIIVAAAMTLSLAAGSAAAQPQFANVVAAVKNQTQLVARSARALRTVRLDSAAHQSAVQRSARRKWVAGTREQAAGIAQYQPAHEIADGLLDLAHDTEGPKIHGA
jgi:hypothetical protein